MTVRKEQQWFDLLHKSQLEDLKVFMKPKYFNVFNGVIDKYSDSAHFIYELLQNADDAGATEVEMQLFPDKFIFAHNGSIRFSISNPDNEVEDRKAGRLGHINSICSIGFSSRKMTSLVCSFTTSEDIEKTMFGESQYIEGNTYDTSHKMTNVFSNPFSKYEIRIDENAIDIQINDF